MLGLRHAIRVQGLGHGVRELGFEPAPVSPELVTGGGPAIGYVEVVLGRGKNAGYRVNRAFVCGAATIEGRGQGGRDGCRTEQK